MKAETVIAEFAYCGIMYKDALKTHERKFGRSQAVVSAHLNKLSSFPTLKMHISDIIINYPAIITGLVGVCNSVSYDSDLKSVSLLNTAPHFNMKHSRSLFTVQMQWAKPKLLDFNDWLKQKAEAHNLVKQSSPKAKSEESINSLVKTKVSSRTFATNLQTKGTQRPASTPASPTNPRCIVCKGKHRIWECGVFKETSPTQGAKVVEEAKLFFS